MARWLDRGSRVAHSGADTAPSGRAGGARAAGERATAAPRGCGAKPTADDLRQRVVLCPFGFRAAVRTSRSLLLATGSAAARCGGGQRAGQQHQARTGRSSPARAATGSAIQRLSGGRAERAGRRSRCLRPRCEAGLADRIPALSEEIRRTYRSNQPPELFSTGVLRQARAYACAFFAAMTGVCTGRCWSESDVIRTVYIFRGPEKMDCHSCRSTVALGPSTRCLSVF